MKRILAVCMVMMMAAMSAFGASNVTLKVWIMPNSPNAKADLDTVIKPFTEKTGIKADVTVLDWGSAWTKIIAASTSGVGPDVVQLGTTWVPTIGSMDVLLDLKKELTKTEQSAFLPASWATKGLASTGAVSTLPWIADVRVLYYRKDVLAKAGLDPATAFATWDSLKETAKKINGMEINGKKIAAIGYPGKNDWNVPHFIAPWVWASGGDFISKDGKKSLVASEEVVKGLDFYSSFYREGLVPKEYIEKNSAEVTARLRTGEIAMMFDVPQTSQVIDQALAGNGVKGEVADKLGAVIPPKGPKGRYTFFGGSNLGVFNFTKNKAEAVKLVKYLCLDKDAQIDYVTFSGHYPTLKSAGETDFVTKSEVRKVIKDATKYGRAYPLVATWGPMETILTKRLGTAWDIIGGVEAPYTKERLMKELKDAEKEMNNAINSMQ